MGRHGEAITEQQLQIVAESYARQRPMYCAMELSDLHARAFHRARQILIERGVIGAEWSCQVNRIVRERYRKQAGFPTSVTEVSAPEWREPTQYKTVFNLICHPQMRSTT